ncbi:hypothetical protein JCM3774_003470 [Rhodotorula dairenensis]
MRSPAVCLAAVPLFALAVSAQGIIDNMGLFSSISDAAHSFAGDYYVQNVKTGKYMYFDRPGDLTNLIAGDERKPIQLGQDKAYGQSGRVWDHWDGTFFRGLNDKCMSAQWGEQGVDVAGVSYACKVGPGSTGSDSLELAKQLWKLVPCGNGGGGRTGGGGEKSFSSASTADFKQLATVEPKDDSFSAEKSAETATFEAKQGDDGPATPEPSETQQDDWAPEETQQAIDPKDRSTWVCRKDGKWLSEHPEYVTEAGRVECKDELDAYVKEHGWPVDDGIDPKDRTTWVCRKDGKWLSEHPDYVWKAGKVECQQRLLDYYAAHGQRKRSYMTKQSKRHAELAKRASSEQTYCIIALDHLTDMTTRAVTGKTIPSFGGYLSVELADWNKDDDAQHWRITPA